MLVISLVILHLARVSTISRRTSAPITYHQADHILDNSRHNNNFSQYYNRGRIKSNTIHSANSIHCNNPKQGKDMILTISTGGYRGDHTWVGHTLDDNDTDSQFNQIDNNMLNNPQGTGIHAFGKIDRELWCTWGSWQGVAQVQLTQPQEREPDKASSSGWT